MKHSLLILLALIALVACDRGGSSRGGSAASVGPQGPQGVQGPAGPAGPRGLPGQGSGGGSLPQGIFDVTDFGALGNGSTDDSAAIQSTIQAAHDIGGGVVWFPPGIYPVGTPLQIGGMNYITFRGAGVDVSVLSSTSPTEPIFASDQHSLWRLWEDLTLTSSVNKTGGALMDLSHDRRSTMRRIKLTQHFDGIHLDRFEVVWLDSVHITNPSGAGIALRVGTQANEPQGANLTINNSFLRGTDGNEGVGANVTGRIGLAIYDCDAVFMFNTDIAGFRQSSMIIEPRTRSFNHHFLQNYFDATTEGPCIDVGGPGGKAQITMTGNWIASAGQIPGGAAGKAVNSVGMRIRNEGSYGPWNMTGGRVFNTLGRGIEVLASSIELAVNGVQFESFGNGGNPNSNDGLFVGTGVNGQSLHVSGCTFFRGSNGDDVETSATANLFSISSSRGNGRLRCGTRPLLSAANAFLGGQPGCN